MTRFVVTLFACGLGCLVLAANPVPVPATTNSAAPAPEPPTKTPKETCLKPCLDCQAECLTGMKHARDHKMEPMAKSLEVCHHACLMCYHAVGSKNVNAWAICELCEKVCNDCATECEKSTDEHMKKCAKACRDCAKACAEARK